MRQLVAVGRLLRVVGHLLVGMWTIQRVFPGLSQSQRDERVQAWARAMLAHLAIKLVVNGQPPQAGPVLLAANHISWIDILVMHAARHCRFVSKSDVKRWPLVGKLASAAGTIYIERESRRDALRVVHQMAECLVRGDVLAVFPEGTTGDGTHVMPFHANLIQAAIASGAPVQPVALHFADSVTGAMSFAPCYIGDDTLVGSLWRTLKTRNLEAVVSYGGVQQANTRDRRTWAADLRSAVIAMRADPQLRV
jgi:1-acyl-sn-glycerol-3-phosphate acyltransferase